MGWEESWEGEGSRLFFEEKERNIWQEREWRRREEITFNGIIIDIDETETVQEHNLMLLYF